MTVQQQQWRAATARSGMKHPGSALNFCD